MTFQNSIAGGARWRRLARTGWLWAALALALVPAPALAVFNSGGTGANGAFPPVAVPSGTTGMVLDLRDGTLTFNPGGTTTQIPSTPAGGFIDGVLQFSSVTIPSGVTLSFVRNVSNTPVTMIVQTTALVDGTINLDGQAGGAGTGPSATGAGGLGGPGGFRGGSGELILGAGGGGAGLGPGGGIGGDVVSPSAEPGGGSYASQASFRPGPIYGQPSLLPLVGGSGGGGATAGNSIGTARGAGGGGGGGAILIAATQLVRVDGAILARGGARGSSAGAGSGGAIRLLSTEIQGTGSLDVDGGDSGTVRAGGLGRIRLEADLQQFAGTLTGVSTASGPGLVMLPSEPAIAITTVDGKAIPANPGGALGQVDVIITSAGTKTIEFAASNVPVGTTISLTAKAEQDGPTVGPVISTALTGTTASSTATATLTFPKAGLFFLEAQATFNIP